MKYKETIRIPREEYERVNKLLALYSLEEMTDNELLEAGANTNQRIGVFGVMFEDGSVLRYDLCSGNSNYYDDVVWNKDGYNVVLECAFELSNISFTVDDNVYEVNLNII